jgi:hypothetical protein
VSSLVSVTVIGLLKYLGKMACVGVVDDDAVVYVPLK